MNSSFNVAGVTFCNEDGESRQEIIKNIGCIYNLATLVQTTYKNERAVEVHINGKKIGYVPKTELNNPLSYSPTLLAEISVFEENSEQKKIYYVKLREIIKPTDKQTSAMLSFCRTHNLRVPDIADSFVYKAYIEHAS